jgi:hypothetical protein
MVCSVQYKGKQRYVPHNMLFSLPQNPECVITLRDEYAFLGGYLPRRAYKLSTESAR